MVSLCTVPISTLRSEVSHFISTASAAPAFKGRRMGLMSAATNSFPGIPLSRGVVGKYSNGPFLKRPGVSFRFSWDWTAALGTTDSPSELECKEDDDDDWESEIFEDFKRPAGRYGKKNEDQDEELSSITREEERLVDWSAIARERAIKAVQERELPVAALLEDGKKKRRKKKKKKSPPPDVRMKKGKLEKLEKMPRDKNLLPTAESVQALMGNPLMKALGSGEGFQELSDLGNYWKSLGDSNAREFRPVDHVRLENGEAESNRIVTPTLKNVFRAGPQGDSGTSRLKRQEDFDLNRKLVGTAAATEVLSLVGDVIGDRVWGQDESPLSPFNASTALHRIAKHMEAASMHKSDRLCFAREKVMAQLVSTAIESLPQSSAQSVSNIAWALSKVGGYSLYGAEMDRLAEVADMKIEDLQPQHIANIAGALASMQHSIPPLFEAFDHRASYYHCHFQSQELAQLLWAFATLNLPAKLLLDSLDSECQSPLPRLEEKVQITDMGPIEGGGDDILPRFLADSFLTDEELESQQDVGKKLHLKSTLGSDGKLEGVIPTRKHPSKWVSAKDYFKSCSLSQLASLSWSYTVLGQLGRPSFALIWHAILNQGLGTTSQGKDLPCPSLQLSQLYQTNLSLQLEFPKLNLSLGQPLESLARKEWENIKSRPKSTSVTQLDVERLLVGRGQPWVAEYTAIDYSLDAALVDEKIGLEIDGPSHFARNTGAPLGHTVLKRRQLAAAGWTVLSIPYQEWDDQLGEQQQTLYLHNLLKYRPSDDFSS